MSDASASAAQPPPPSPWKKPLPSVRMNKSNQTKRKASDHLLNNTTGGCGGGDSSFASGSFSSQQPPSPKRKSRFAFSASNTEKTSTPTEQDLYNFFQKEEEQQPLTSDSSFNVSQKLLSTSFNPQLIKPYTADTPSPSLLSSPLLNNSNIFRKSFMPPNDNENTNIYSLVSDCMPIDWSLKSEVVFWSKNKFECNSAIKSHHESEATINFSKFDTFYQRLNSVQSQTTERRDSLYKSLLWESTLYWIFPYLPGVKLYPRTISSISNMSEQLNSSMQKSLSDCWKTSFKSLYYSLKNAHCPYFYLLTHSFAVLFRTSNKCCRDIHAILTPSTVGLRNMLKAEDIEFTMPFVTNNKNEPNDDKNNENDDDDDDEEPTEWLQKQGLDSSSYKSTSFKRTVSSLDAPTPTTPPVEQCNVHHSRSTLLVQGDSNVQALFNFLLNSNKSCFMSSGPMTNVPPTLLSPTAFVGATMQRLRVEPKQAKQPSSDGGPSLVIHGVRLEGPVMPFHVHRLCTLFRLTQLSDFKMVLERGDSSNSVCEQTTAFNCVARPTMAQVVAADADCFEADKEDSEHHSLEKFVGIFGQSQACRLIVMQDGMYHCNFK